MTPWKRAQLLASLLGVLSPEDPDTNSPMAPQWGECMEQKDTFGAGRQKMRKTTPRRIKESALRLVRQVRSIAHNHVFI